MYQMEERWVLYNNFSDGIIDGTFIIVDGIKFCQ